jgi:tetratricopeptide (TPR) repeat protein
MGLGLTWMYDGAFDRARRELTVALSGFRAIGDRWGMIMSLAAYAELASLCDDPAAAIEPMEEALRLAGELGSIIDRADLLRVRGDGHVRVGELDRAHADYASAVQSARRCGAPETTAAALAGLGEVARLRGDLGAARHQYESALSECPTGWFAAEATRSGIRVALGRIAQAAGDSGTARTWYGRALTDTAGLRIAPSWGQAVEALVGIELTSGDDRRAALLLGATTALLRATGPVELAELTGTVRSLVGDAAYESAYRRGAAMTRGQALAVIAGP